MIVLVFLAQTLRIVMPYLFAASGGVIAERAGVISLTLEGLMLGGAFSSALAAFYFDSITQLQLDSWSRGRVTLVGDAGYCPGPAVGGSTSLAVLGAYVLAGELAAAGGDHERAYPAYEREMGELVRRSRAFARGAVKALIPTSTLGVRALVGGARLLSALPTPISRVIAKANNKGLRLHDSMPVKAYP